MLTLRYCVYVYVSSVYSRCAVKINIKTIGANISIGKDLNEQ